MFVRDKELFKEVSKPWPDACLSDNYVFGTLGKLFALLFLRLPFTPNQITWFWGGLMVLSSLLYATGEWLFCILGGVIWIVAYGLDYTDGIVAKYRGQTSARGAYLDMIVHRATYPLLMFCIGYGAYVSGGISWMDLNWFHDTFYIYLGVAAGISMLIIQDVTPLYEKYKEGDKAFDDRRGSKGVEAKLFKNQKTFEILMDINPLIFTNMMLMLLLFAIFNQMGLFIVLYGIGYPIVTTARVLLLYKDL